MAENIIKPYFRHFVAEITCPFEWGNSLSWIEEKAQTIVKQLELGVVKKFSHTFQPQGITLVYILSSSHMAIHSWPENNFVHIDIVLCSKNIDYKKIEETIKITLPNVKYKLTELIY